MWLVGVINFLSHIWGGGGISDESGGGGVVKNFETQMKMYPTPPTPDNKNDSSINN